MKHSSATLALFLATFASAALAVDPPQPPEKLREIKRPTIAVPLLKTPAPASIAVPNGSYLASCQNVRIEGDEVHASCKRRDGDRWDTGISVAGCSGVDIFNNDGVLMCATPVRARWNKTVLPPGSYIASCFGYVEGTTLRAACKTGSKEVTFLGLASLEMPREGLRQNRMDLTRCPDGSEIANLRGDLTCIAK